MKLLDWLARLGILRFGVKAGTYTSGKDRPVEFFMPGVFNAERDLGAGNNMNPVECPACKAKAPFDATVCPACGKPLGKT